MGILVLINKTVEIHFCAPWLGSPVRTEWGSLTFHILFMCMQCVCAIWKCLTQKKQQQQRFTRVNWINQRLLILSIPCGQGSLTRWKPEMGALQSAERTDATSRITFQWRCCYSDLHTVCAYRWRYHIESELSFGEGRLEGGDPGSNSRPAMKLIGLLWANHHPSARSTSRVSVRITPEGRRVIVK